MWTFHLRESKNLQAVACDVVYTLIIRAEHFFSDKRGCDYFLLNKTPGFYLCLHDNICICY